MKKITYILAAAALLLLPSCRFIKIDESKDGVISSLNFGGNKNSERVKASDNYISRGETTGEFHSLTSNLPGKIIYKPGDCGVSIYGPDNILDHISVYNEDGFLEIRSDLFRISNLKELRVEVSSPVLENLNLTGAVDFKAPEGITALNFNAVLNGAGDVHIDGLQANEANVSLNGAADIKVGDLDCDFLKLDIRGAGDATLAGQAGSAELSISGAGDIDAQKLDCANLKTSIRGVGSIKKPKNN